MTTKEELHKQIRTICGYDPEKGTDHTQALTEPQFVELFRLIAAHEAQAVREAQLRISWRYCNE